MSELFSVAAVFILSFLGLMVIVAGIFFLWLAYRYDINFSIHTKEKVKAPPASAPVPGKHESVS